MAHYYPDDYGPHQMTLPVAESAVSILRRYGRKLMNTRAQALPEVQPGMLLEVGCGSGAFLARMAAEGWQVLGLDATDRAAELAHARGIEVHRGQVSSLEAEPASFNMIVGWMVLEHLHDPIEDLSRLRELVRDDGWLAVSVPDAGSLEFRLFRDKWYSLDLPRHLYHFTPATVSATLARSGWEVRRVMHQRTVADLVASLGYVLESRRWSPPRLVRRLVRFPEHPGRLGKVLSPFAWVLAGLGQTGRIVVWAQPSR